jgi:uncharacterized protein DUF5677
VTERSELPSAAEAYPDFFVQTDAVIAQFHLWIDRDDIPADGTWWGIVQLAILVRAFNQYRSIVNLLRNNHWEDALILVRSLFELLLNTEELSRHTSDIEVAAESFVAFAHLQRYLRWRETELYNITTGRAGDEARARVHEMDGLARKFFAPFWEEKKGRGRWRTNWSRKNVADLCHLSVNPLREHHYRLLYGRGSEFTHSAPVAVFATFRLRDEPEELRETIRAVDQQEERELRETGSMATIFLFELAALIGRRLPAFDLEWCAEAGMPLIARMLGLPESAAAEMRTSFLAWLATRSGDTPD